MKRLLVGLLNVLGAVYVAASFIATFVVMFALLALWGFGPFGMPVWLASFLGAFVLSAIGIYVFVKRIGDDDSIFDTDLSSNDAGLHGTFFDD